MTSLRINGMRFKVKNMARINEADIDVKPLTIFVGKNGVNKSYLAHLSYEIYKIFGSIDETVNSNIVIDILNMMFNKEGFKSRLDFINSLKTTETEEFERYQIDEDQFEEDIYIKINYKIDIDDTRTFQFLETIKEFVLEYFLIRFNKSYNVNSLILEEIYFDIDLKEVFKSGLISVRKSSDDDQKNAIGLLKRIVMRILKHLASTIDKEKCFYFPSSRTGFVLAFDEIVAGVFRDKFGGQLTATKLTEPTIDFLSYFADMKTGKYRDDMFFMWHFDATKNEDKEINNIIKFIEQNIIQGKLLEEKIDNSYTQYFLKTGNKKLDLHVTSSATIELLPLIVFLKHFAKIDNKFLVIEEPEAHLHPKAQIEMARFIVMLVNAGAKVMITTHSDYILSEINNLIKLSTIDEDRKAEYRKQYKIDRDISIKSSQVSAYLFKTQKDNSVDVNKLEIDEYGISNENFDEVLDELTWTNYGVRTLLFN